MSCYRAYPSILLLWLSLSIAGSSASLLIASILGGPIRNICTLDEYPVATTMDNAGYNGGQGVICILQGILITYFGLAHNYWWLASTHNNKNNTRILVDDKTDRFVAVTFNIFLVLCFPKQEWVLRYGRWFNIGYEHFHQTKHLKSFVVVVVY